MKYIIILLFSMILSESKLISVTKEYSDYSEGIIYNSNTVDIWKKDKDGKYHGKQYSYNGSMINERIYTHGILIGASGIPPNKHDGQIYDIWIEHLLFKGIK